MARAIWKGVIVIGSGRLPVKLYSAVQDRSVHFRLLHERDGVPVRQHMVHPGTGKVVESDDVRRGYEVEPGRFVILNEDDLEATQPEPSRDIEVLRFVPSSRIDGKWYDRPYYLGPDEDTATYFAFRDALSPRDRVGLVRWAMRKKEYIGALRVAGEHLMLIALHHPAEIVPASALPSPSGRAMGERELAMAEQLIATLEGPFDPGEFRDEYRDRVLDFVKSKAEGREVVIPEEEVPEEAGSLEEMLERSLTRGKERAVA